MSKYVWHVIVTEIAGPGYDGNSDFFSEDLSEEEQLQLSGELYTYECRNSTTRWERDCLYEWVRHGNSPYSNPWGYYYKSGDAGPLEEVDFLKARKIASQMRKIRARGESTRNYLEQHGMRRARLGEASNWPMSKFLYEENDPSLDQERRIYFEFLKTLPLTF